MAPLPGELAAVWLEMGTRQAVPATRIADVVAPGSRPMRLLAVKSLVGAGLALPQHHLYC